MHRIEDRLAGERHPQFRRDAPEPHLHVRPLAAVLNPRRPCQLAGEGPGAEALDLDLRFRHPEPGQRRGRAIHHRPRPADEEPVDGLDIDQPGRQFRHLGLVHQPAEQLDLGDLVAQNVKDLEPPHEAVLQVGQFVAKDDGARRPVAVEQREARAGSRPSTARKFDITGVIPDPPANPT
jgi:hypothetical protein